MKPPRYVLLETNYGTYTTYGVALDTLLCDFKDACN